MIETVQLCVVPSCARRAATPRLLCWSDRDQLARLLDPRNVGGVDVTRIQRDAQPGAQPGGIAELYRVAAEGHGDDTQRPGEHADAARINLQSIAIRDVRTSATGPGLDDDGWRAVDRRLSAGHDDPWTDPLAGPRSVLATLGGWARVAHEDLGDPLPRLARLAFTEVRRPVPTTDPDRLPAWRSFWARRAVTAPDVQAVQALCSWLHARTDWITAQPWIDELLPDVRHAASQLRSASGDPGGRAIGPCSATVDLDTGALDPLSTTLCGAELYAPVPGTRDPGPIDLPSIRCNTCGARWAGAALLQLARARGLLGDPLTATGCPVHDLPADRPVRIRIVGTLHEDLAGAVCAAWHAEHHVRATG